MTILQIIIVLTILLIAPLLFGKCIAILCRKTEFTTMELLYGWLFLLSAFEIFAVPATFLRMTLTGLCRLFTIFMAAAAIFCIFVILRRRKTGVFLPAAKKPAIPTNLCFLCAAALILFQLFIAAFGTHLDGDDAYYLGTAATSLSTDTLFVYEPDNGTHSFSQPPARYAFSALMLLWAYVSKLSGMHPLIIAHTIAPLLLIPMAYLALWNIGCLLFPTKEQASLFLLFLNVFHMFGFTSVYTQQAFFLLRIWQGKAMLPNLIFPVYLFLFLELYKGEKSGRNWVLIFITSAAACCCSSMAVPLCLIFLACGTTLLFFFQKKWTLFLKGGVCCLPCLTVGLAYLFLQ